MESLSDEELFKRVQKGKKESMEVIVGRYYKNIFRYIYSKTNEYHISEDLCQEVFCKVYKNREGYSEKYLFKPWIYKIALNCVIDYTRSKLYRDRKGTTILDENIKEKDNIIEYKLFNNNIDDFIEDLNEEQKEVLKLRFCENMSIEDIALVMESTVNTTKSRLYQGIKHVKKRMKNIKGGDLYEAWIK